MSPEVIITISPQGKAQIEVKGVTGPRCAELTRELESALGNKLLDVKKPEFLQSSSRLATREMIAGK